MTTRLPYPHTHHDCRGYGEYDADMQVANAERRGRPIPFCHRCIGTALLNSVTYGATLVVSASPVLMAHLDGKDPSDGREP